MEEDNRMTRRTSPLLVCVLALALSGIAYAHVGIEIFIPQVPNPSAMTIDGSEDDWGWIDDDFKTTPEFMFTAGGEAVPKDDYDLVFMSAYSPPPDNRFYFFIRVQDDTLRILEEDQKRWWNDDCIQITFDPDHSGGDFLGENIDQVLNAQRYHLRVKPLPGQPVAFNSLLEYIDLPSIGWSSDVFEGELTGPDVFEIAWTLNPADAAHLSTNVSYTFEFACAMWDIHGITKDEAVRHIFAADQTIHVGPRPLDGDGGETGAKHQLYHLGSSTGQDQKGDQMPDYVLLAGEGSTAVKSDSWGRIKSHVNRQLQ
jgi:hypothetical protein